MAVLRATTDGVVTIRPSTPSDTATLVRGRDDVFQRFLGPGSADPKPTGCIVVDGAVVGWVDYDAERPSLEPGEVNLGYNVFAPHRGKGYASRAVQLLMHHLADDTSWATATLLIHPDNDRSLALARRLRFVSHGELDGSRYWKRPIPALTYTDSFVTIRGGRGAGPKWMFAAAKPEAPGVASIYCDLAHERVPHGEAKISYATHPPHGDHRCTGRAVQLSLMFLRDHTGARSAHMLIGAEDTAAQSVAVSAGASDVERFTDATGRTLIRFVKPF